jgi:hypothetical protein
MSMTRKQKREYHTMQAKVERLRAELARRDSVLTSPPSTNANNVTEDAMSPPMSSATGVDPDTEMSETGPPKDINVAERVGSPKVSFSKGVESDTVHTETVSPTDTSITERAISPTASLSQQVDPATVQTEAGPQSRVNHAKVMTEGVVALHTTPPKSTTSAEELVLLADQITPRVGTKTDQSYLRSLESATLTEDENSPTALAPP